MQFFLSPEHLGDILGLLISLFNTVVSQGKRKVEERDRLREW